MQLYKVKDDGKGYLRDKWQIRKGQISYLNGTVTIYEKPRFHWKDTLKWAKWWLVEKVKNKS